MMLQATDALPINIGFTGKGNTSSPEGLVEQIRAGAVGLKLHEDWGTTPAGHRLLPLRRRGRGRAGHHPHRHAQRVGLRRRLDRRLQGPHDPHLPLRRRRRRARARHHPRLRRAQRHPQLHQPDAAVHGQHARRAPRHAHGLPPPRQDHPRGRGLRREPHPRRDDRRRGHPARPRAPSASSRATARPWAASARSSRAPGRRPTRCASERGRLAERARRQRQRRASSATSPSTRSTRPSPTACRTRSAAIEVGKRADLVLWRPAFFGCSPELVLKGGFIAWAQMGDANASIPTPQPLRMRPMFGAHGRAVGGDEPGVRLPARGARGRPRGARARQARRAGARAAAASASETWCTTTRCRRSPSIPRRTRSARTVSSFAAGRRRGSRSRSSTRSSEAADAGALAAPADRRLGLPDGRVRPLQRPRGRGPARPRADGRRPRRPRRRAPVERGLRRPCRS